MPVKVQKRGKKWCAVEPGGGAKKGRCHSTKTQATKQARAINMSLRKSGKI